MTGEMIDGQEHSEMPPKLTLADLRALTPADLRDLSELRREHAALKDTQARLERDHASLQEEANFLREQLAVALAGWRDAQRRPPQVSVTQTDEDAPEEETVDPQPSGAWARVWGWLAD
jgi:hypothetical protein